NSGRRIGIGYAGGLISNALIRFGFWFGVVLHLDAAQAVALAEIAAQNGLGMISARNPAAAITLANIGINNRNRRAAQPKAMPLVPVAMVARDHALFGREAVNAGPFVPPALAGFDQGFGVVAQGQAVALVAGELAVADLGHNLLGENQTVTAAATVRAGDAAGKAAAAENHLAAHRPKNVGRFAAIVLKENIGCLKARLLPAECNVVSFGHSANDRLSVPLALQPNGLANLYLTLQPVYFR